MICMQKCEAMVAPPDEFGCEIAQCTSESGAQQHGDMERIAQR
jgi:hypothetical protein